jgi:hypothetical protein
MEKHIERLVATVEHIIRPDMTRIPPASAEPEPVSHDLPAPPPVPEPAAVTTPVTERPRAPAGPPAAAPVPNTRALVIGGVVLVVIILLFAGTQMGLFGFPMSLNASDSVKSNTPGSVNYRSSDAVVNTVVLTTEPTQTLAKDTELYVDANKDDTNAMVTVRFNGGPGMGLVKDSRVILTRSDGTVSEDKLNFKQQLSDVMLQGTRGTDRIQVIVILYSGSEKTIVDRLLPYRTYN